MSEKTRIGRHSERSVEDWETICEILDEGLVCHAAYVIDSRPVVIPTLYAREGEHLLVHGSNSMGLARAVRGGSPLSIAVTHLDGLVVARSAFNSSANYRSVIVHGHGRLLEPAEKKEALDVIVERLIPGRLADVRESTDSEIAQTSVIEIPLDEVSAKVRTGDPVDDPDDLGAPVWAGVVPLHLMAEEPLPAHDLQPDVEIPDYLRPYRR